MIVNGAALLKAAPMSPMVESKQVEHGLSFGMSFAGYDLRVRQSVTLSSDNRISNLRECIPTENSMNAALPSNNTSGHIGVSLDKRSGRWEAHIGMPGTGRKLSLGLFDSMDFAIVARKAAERALGYHRNHGRVRQ